MGNLCTKEEDHKRRAVPYVEHQRTIVDDVTLFDALDKLRYWTTSRSDIGFWQECVENKISLRDDRKGHITFDNWALAFIRIASMLKPENRGNLVPWAQIIVATTISNGPQFAQQWVKAWPDSYYTGLKQIMEKVATSLFEYSVWPEGSAWRIFKKYMVMCEMADRDFYMPSKQEFENFFFKIPGDPGSTAFMPAGGNHTDKYGWDFDMTLSCLILLKE